jgi:hypothetical protein
VLGQVQAADIETLGKGAIALFIVAFLLVFAIMVALLWVGWWVTNRRGSRCPYTKALMRPGEDLAFSAATRVQHFLSSMDDPANPAFELRYAAISQDTFRIYSDCVNIFGVVKLDWGFLKKHHPGHWVSWGSLSEEQQKTIKARHRTLEGFQTESSSLNPRPRDVELYFAALKPGPLYVDVSTATLLGWKIVPSTDLEVLVVQKPFYPPEESHQ